MRRSPDVSIEQRQRARELAICAKILASCGDVSNALGYAESTKGCPARVVDFFKAAQTAGSTQDAVWALPLAQSTLGAAFVANLQHASLLATMIANCPFAPMHTNVVSARTRASGAITVESAPRAIGEMAFGSVNLQPRRVDAAVILSQEVVEQGGPLAIGLVEQQMAAAASAAGDAALIAAVNDPSPIPAIIGTGDPVADLANAIALIDLCTTSQIIVGASPKKLASLALRLDGADDLGIHGGRYRGMIFTPSEACGEDIEILDASAWAVGPSSLTVDVFRQGAVQLDSVPTNPPVAATVAISLWQMNLRAVAARWYFAIAPHRENGGAAIINPSW